MELIQAPLREKNAFKIMIVEDDEAVAVNLQRGLVALGRDVCLAHSKTEALQILNACPEVAVVVTDIRMPGGSGLELAEAIGQAANEQAAAEVIVITGHATLQHVTDALRSGACDFLPKPFRLAEADAAISKAAARALHRRATERQKRGQASATSGLDRELAALRGQLAEAQATFQTPKGRDGWPDQDFQKACVAVSHALRTSLNAISGGAQLIETNFLSDQEREYLELLRGGVKGAVTAIELVEELNRLQPGEQAAASSFDLSAYVQDAAAAAGREGGLVPCPRAGWLALPFMVTAGPLRIRRAVALCFAAAADWAPPGSQASYDVRAARRDQDSFACLTITISPAGQDVTPPPEIAFSQVSSLLSATVESLRFIIAQRLVAHCGGLLTSWTGSATIAAIRLALPLSKAG